MEFYLWFSQEFKKKLQLKTATCQSRNNAQVTLGEDVTVTIFLNVIFIAVNLDYKNITVCVILYHSIVLYIHTYVSI